MMLILRQIFKLLKLIHSEAGALQLSSGVVMGMWLGFVPMNSLLTLLFFTLLILFRINMGLAFLAVLIFKPLSFLLDPLFDRVGYATLLYEPLESFWAYLESAPIVPFTRFYNTIVMGSIVVCLLLSIPLFFLSRFIIQKYRDTIVTRIKQSTIWRACTATKLYQLYENYLATS